MQGVSGVGSGFFVVEELIVVDGGTTQAVVVTQTRLFPEPLHMTVGVDTSLPVQVVGGGRGGKSSFSGGWAGSSGSQ